MTEVTDGRKIFGIGLQRTGTGSLCAAMRILGVNCQHNPISQARQLLDNGTVELPFEAATDFGQWCYPQLDRLYPGSLFILTTRDEGDWLESCRKHWIRTAPNHRLNECNDLSRRKITAIFGALVYDPEWFRLVYRRHVEGVHNYFKRQPDRLLTIHVATDDRLKWSALADFLGKHRLSTWPPWPHKHSWKNYVGHKYIDPDGECE